MKMPLPNSDQPFDLTENGLKPVPPKPKVSYFTTSAPEEISVSPVEISVSSLKVWPALFGFP